jgi:hypothetical protein
MYLDGGSGVGVENDDYSGKDIKNDSMNFDNYNNISQPRTTSSTTSLETTTNNDFNSDKNEKKSEFIMPTGLGVKKNNFNSYKNNVPEKNVKEKVNILSYIFVFIGVCIFLWIFLINIYVYSTYIKMLYVYIVCIVYICIYSICIYIHRYIYRY